MLTSLPPYHRAKPALSLSLSLCLWCFSGRIEGVGSSVSGKQMLYDKVCVQIHLMWGAEEGATGVTLGGGWGGRDRYQNKSAQ